MYADASAMRLADIASPAGSDFGADALPPGALDASLGFFGGSGLSGWPPGPGMPIATGVAAPRFDAGDIAAMWLAYSM